jgi:hypothetical protein
MRGGIVAAMMISSVKIHKKNGYRSSKTLSPLTRHGADVLHHACPAERVSALGGQRIHEGVSADAALRVKSRDRETERGEEERENGEEEGAGRV